MRIKYILSAAGDNHVTHSHVKQIYPEMEYFMKKLLEADFEKLRESPKTAKTIGQAFNDSGVVGHSKRFGERGATKDFAHYISKAMGVDPSDLFDKKDNNGRYRFSKEGLGLVASWQSNHNLTADRAIGVKTVNAMAAELGHPTLPVPGQKNSVSINTQDLAPDPSKGTIAKVSVSSVRSKGASLAPVAY